MAWGNPLAEADANAEAEAEAEADADADAEARWSNMPQYNQMGGPGYNAPGYNYQNAMYRPGLLGAGAPNEETPEPVMGAYGSLNMPTAGNVMPVPDNVYNNFEPSIPLAPGPIAPGPIAPAPPVNAQGEMYTRSYTSMPSYMPGRRCYNVCRQSRPNYWPSCRPSCSVRRPSCSTRRPMIDYQVQGNTMFCKPRRCGRYGCGGSGTRYPNIDVTYPNGGSGYNPGTNGGSGYNPGTNGGSGYNPGCGGGYSYGCGNAVPLPAPIYPGQESQQPTTATRYNMLTGQLAGTQYMNNRMAENQAIEVSSSGVRMPTGFSAGVNMGPVSMSLKQNDNDAIEVSATTPDEQPTA